MNHMLQIKVTADEAEKFVSRMETCGYEAVRVSQGDIADIHFVKDGKTTIDYSVTIYTGDEPYAFIGVRPA